MGHVKCDAAGNGMRFIGQKMPGRWARAAARAAVAAALALPVLAQAQAQADLVANNAGPTVSAAGAAFTYTVTLTNNGPWAADGATFTTTMPQNATNVGAVCTSATSGADCPAVFTVSNTVVNGAIPRFPDQGEVVITITGNYGVPSPTSVTSTVTITPPPGVGETEPATNSSTVNTNLITDAKLRVSKTHSGGPTEVIYTITLVNDGNAAADGARFRDYLNSSSSPTSAASHATVNASFVACRADGGAQCPANDRFGSFSGIKGPTNRTLFDTMVPKLPAGGSLTVVYRATITPDTETCGLSTASLYNYATITPPSGITNQFGTPTIYDHLSVQGTANCPNRPAWPYSLTKTQHYAGGSFAYGEPITYTISVTNNSSESADGAQLRDWVATPSSSSHAAYHAGLEGHLVSCEAVSGAECPEDTAFRSVTAEKIYNRRDLFSNVAIPVFPPGGQLTIKYAVTLTKTDQCGLAEGYFDNNASVSPPPDYAGTYIGVEVEKVRTTPLPATPPCPRANIELTKTQSVPAAKPGVPFEYEINVINKGPESADGASWVDYVHATSGGTFLADMYGKFEYIACEAFNDAACPARDRFREYLTPTRLNANTHLVSSGTTIPRLPVGGHIRLRYRVTLEPLKARSCRSQTAIMRNYTAVHPAWPKVGGRSAQVDMSLTCADIGVSKNVEPIQLKAGEDVTYTVMVSNSGLGPASGVGFSDPLPSFFEFKGASCATVEESVPENHPRTECGDTVDYDPATHTLTSTIKAIGQLGAVQFIIKGKAGSLPGTYTNEATAMLPAGLFDPIMTSNITDVNVQIANTRSPITVTKRVAGLPASGAPADMQFTGTVTCGVQPVQNWSITVPAGAVSGSSAPLTFYDTEVCTVGEDTPPAPPPGYAWDGAPSIGNSTDPLGPSTAREVTVVNTLKRLSAGVELSKRFSGPAEAIEKVDGTFSFELDCGADGQYQQDVVVVGGAAASVTLSDLPAGASCRVRETATPAAPAGYEWGTPEYSADPVIIPVEAGGTVDLEVTNPLKSSAVPPPTPVPTLGLPLLAALAGLLGGLGAFYRRRQSASAG